MIIIIILLISNIYSSEIEYITSENNDIIELTKDIEYNRLYNNNKALENYYNNK